MERVPETVSMEEIFEGSLVMSQTELKDSELKSQDSRIEAGEISQEEHNN